MAAGWSLSMADTVNCTPVGQPSVLRAGRGTHFVLPRQRQRPYLICQRLTTRARSTASAAGERTTRVRKGGAHTALTSLGHVVIRPPTAIRALELRVSTSLGAGARRCR